MLDHAPTNIWLPLLFDDRHEDQCRQPKFLEKIIQQVRTTSEAILLSIWWFRVVRALVRLCGWRFRGRNSFFAFPRLHIVHCSPVPITRYIWRNNSVHDHPLHVTWTIGRNSTVHPGNSWDNKYFFHALFNPISGPWNSFNCGYLI